MVGLKLVELGPRRTFRSAELQTRADQNPWSRHRLQFLAKLSGAEVAFLSFDLVPAKDYLVLYELFIAEPHRRRGLGSALLAYAEAIAQGKGLRLLLLRPSPLAQGTQEDWLRRWYLGRGFEQWEEDPAVLAKRVPLRASTD